MLLCIINSISSPLKEYLLYFYSVHIFEHKVSVNSLERNLNKFYNTSKSNFVEDKEQNVHIDQNIIVCL